MLHDASCSIRFSFPQLISLEVVLCASATVWCIASI